MDDLKLFAKNKKIGNSNTHRIYSQDIGMEFGIEKCAKIKSRKQNMIKGMEQPN